MTKINYNSGAVDFIKRNLTFIIVILVTLALLIGGVFLFSKGGGKTTANKIGDAILIPPGTQITSGIVNGKYLPRSESATVSIVEFGDYQCPACGAYETLVNKILTNFSGKINFAFHDFAFVGPESQKASEAAYCAFDQGKYWEYHSYLYTHQNGENKGAFGDPNLKSFAGTLGLNAKSFSDCLDSNKYKKQVEDFSALASPAGVNSTPTFFLNGVKIANPRSEEEFIKVVQEAIDKGSIQESTASEAYHVHFDLKVVVNGAAVNFALPKYQESKDNPLDENIHFHDGNGKVVHVHKEGIPLKDLFDSFSLVIPEGSVAYVNGVRSDNILSYVPKDLDRILIGTTNLNLVSNDSCIYSLKCPERGTPPPEDCVGGLGTGCEVN